MISNLPRPSFDDDVHRSPQPRDSQNAFPTATLPLPPGTASQLATLENPTLAEVIGALAPDPYAPRRVLGPRQIHVFRATSA